MATVTRAVPTAKVTSFANRDTTQVSADTQHDQPLASLESISIVLWVSQLAHGDRVSFLDLALCSVSDEDRLTTPLDGGVLAFWDGRYIDFSFCEGKDVSRGREVGEDVSDSGLCAS